MVAKISVVELSEYKCDVFCVSICSLSISVATMILSQLLDMINNLSLFTYSSYKTFCSGCTKHDLLQLVRPAILIYQSQNPSSTNLCLTKVGMKKA